MCKWNAVCRRFLAVVVLVAGLIVLPSVPAFAAADSGEGEAELEDSGILAQAVEWLVDLFGGEEETAESDTGPTFDPAGRR